jgi:hypothetical protein
MTIFDPLKALCAKFAASRSWAALFAHHGLDLAAADLAAELQKPLTVDRTLIGFDDFADDGRRAIEPGSPSRSLLYHALASPNVVAAPDGTPLDMFPTPAMLESVENYVFGVTPPSITELQARFPGTTLAIVVFACEYRPAPQTVHGRHADLTFARTGVARVGTRQPRYVPEYRGFHPEVPAEPFAIAVSPARYAAYLAVVLPGERDKFLPTRFRPGDASRQFWVPVHKLFDGTECVRDFDLRLTFSARHVNEKIYRVHKVLGGAPPTTPPYRLVSGLGEMSADPAHGPGWLVPVAHPHLVAEATTAQGDDVTFAVPAGNGGTWATFSLLDFKNVDFGGPAYVHARTEVLANGARRNLNNTNNPPVDRRVGAGGYNALHYVDFTADGWVTVACPALDHVVGIDANGRPAYSLIAAPDFFPSCDQRELTEWTASNAVPRKLREQIWNVEPRPLCDERAAANLQLPESPFMAADDTMTALVGLPLAPAHSPNPKTTPALRHSHLSDDASGEFAPGWDVGRDQATVNGQPVDHLAVSSLGSPFPEDAKLCAALSTFWPAVAPDVTRSMDTAPDANLSGTVAPLTDAEIGRVGGLPWDGVPGPAEITVNGKAYAQYNSFLHADYVQNALDDRFSSRLTSKVDFVEYRNRVLAMAHVYLALGVERTSPAQNPALNELTKERKLWVVLSFTALLVGSAELTQAGLDAGVSLRGPIYRVTVFRAAGVETPTNFRKRRMPIRGRIELIAAPTDAAVLLRPVNEPKWRVGVVKIV